MKPERKTDWDQMRSFSHRNASRPEPDELEKQSSLNYWWPIVSELGIPVPKTTIVPLTDREISRMNEEWLPKSVVKRVTQAADRIGYPVFVRTDQASGKHSWERSCFVPSADVMTSHIYEVLEFNLNADIMGLPFSSMVVRKYIPLEAPFTAFEGNMPVARERRYFVRDGVVECHHEYWITGAVRQGMQYKDMPESEWLPLLTEINRQDVFEVLELSAYATLVGHSLPGYWSVDFAKSVVGQWLLIDMGRGEISYHKPDCPKNQEGAHK